MATHIVGKSFKNYRSAKHGRIQQIGGYIAASQYTSGDTFKFTSVSDKNLLFGTIVVELDTPQTLTILQGSDLSAALTVTAANSGTEVPIRYAFTVLQVSGAQEADTLQLTVELGS